MAGLEVLRERESVGVVDIRPLKRFAENRLPLGSHLRAVLLHEDSSLAAGVFLARLKVWLMLMRVEQEQRGSSGW